MQANRFGLLIAPTTNIGDDIQALAAAGFLPRISTVINREQLRQYKGEKVKVIMNGWYMHCPENWPPSSHIHPLFISIHIDPFAADRMLSPEGVAYLKQFEPVGARDFYTRDLLREKGVDAYFSGCLTLTLGQHYKLPRLGLYFLAVDVKKQILKELPNTVRKRLVVLNNTYYMSLDKCINNVWDKIPCSVKDIIKEIISVRRLRQWRAKLELSRGKNLSLNQRLSMAMNRLMTISMAEVVITSRLHIALPSLALGVPVVFIHENLSDPRFGGLIDLIPHFTPEQFLDIARAWDWSSFRVSDEAKRKVNDICAQMNERVNCFMDNRNFQFSHQSGAH